MSDTPVPGKAPDTGEEHNQESALKHTFDPTTRRVHRSGTVVDTDELTGTAATFDPEPGTPLPSLTRDQDLGRYKVLKLLGSGGMGEVWRVWDPSLRREVALKIMNQRSTQATRRLARFLAEAQATAQLQHPGVVPVYDHGQLPDGRPYYTMKVIEGRTLGEIVPGLHANTTADQWGSTADGMTFLDLVGVLHAVSEALAYAHERGVVHRDIKPANILIGHYGEVLLVDWGLVKILGESIEPTDAGPVQTDPSLQSELATRFGAVAGTKGFMPPEQAMGQTDLIDPSSDVYALGAVLWYILTGRVPRNVDGIARGLDDLPRLDPSLCEICLRALSPAQEDRPEHAGQVAEQIGRWLQGARAEAQAAASARHAEDAIQRLSMRDQRLVRIWSLRVVDPDGRVGTISTTADQTEQIDRLLKTELFVHDDIGVTFADPSLAETWSRLQTWRVEHSELHLQLHALSSATRDWVRAHRSDRFLWTDPDVVNRSQVTAEQMGLDEQAFVVACKAALEQRRQKRRLFSALVILFLTASTALSLGQWLDAVQARNAEAVARIEAESRSLNQQGHRALAEKRPHAAVAYFQAAEAALPDHSRSDASDTVAALSPVRIYGGHSGDIKATAWSPDSRLVATGSLDTTVQVWRPETGETVQMFKHSSGIRKVVWSPDGRYVATCTLEGELRIWEVSSGAMLHQLPDDNPWVTALRFLRNGRLVAADRDGVVRLYDPASGVVTHTLEGHGHYVFASDETPDGRWLVTASVDQTVRVWDLSDGAPHRVLEHPVQLLYVTITPDGRRVAVAGTEDPRVWLWDTQTGEQIAVLEADQEFVSVVDASPDSRTLVTMGGARSAHIWSAETGAHLLESQRFEGDDVTGGGFSPDGRFIGLSTSVESVVFIDAKTGAILSHENRHGTTLRSLRWAPDGASVLTGHPDGTASLHQLLRMPIRQAEPCGAGGVFDAQFAPDNRWLAIALARGGMCITSLDTGQPVATMDGPVGNLMWGPGSQRLSFWKTSSNDTLVQIWDRVSGTIQTYLPGEPTASQVSISPDGRSLRSVSRTDSIVTASIETGEETGRTPLPGRPLTSQFSSERVLVTYHDRTADVWDIPTGTQLALDDRSDVEPAARALDPSGRFVVWESSPGTLEKVPLDGGTGWQIPISTPPMSIQLSHSGRWVVTADGDQAARVYAARTGALAMALSFEGTKVRVHFSSSDRRMLLVTDTGEARVYRLRDGALLTAVQLEGSAEIGWAHLPTDTALVTVSNDLVTRTWSVPEEPLAPGASSNLRPCRTGDLVPVTPWPDSATVWAPDVLCTRPEAVAATVPVQPEVDAVD